MHNNIIKAIPDYLYLSTQDFIRHFGNLLSTKKYRNWIKYEESTKILGYSCRTLFDMTLKVLNKEDLVIAATPMHHTSYRNIIENYVKPENLHVLPMNKEYNGLGEIPDLEKCDAIVITHLFGQDMDLSPLKKLKDKHNCIIIEDRVQGGSLDEIFSNDIVDIAIYSMGMDKRPIALGGGYIYIKNDYEKIIADFLELYESLPTEKTRTRFKELLKKVPTYMIYNYRPFVFLLMRMLNLLHLFNEDISILSITKSYRKNNPGFIRSGFMMKPSNGLMKSMVENSTNYKQMELHFARKHAMFVEYLTPKLINYYFPWYKEGVYSLSNYTTIQIEEHLVDTFLEFMDSYNISTLPNPTYKLFNKAYKGDAKDIKFNNGIVYLPSTANITQEEMEFIRDRLVEFYLKYKK